MSACKGAEYVSAGRGMKYRLKEFGIGSPVGGSRGRTAVRWSALD